jgi:hypothetical protein
MIAESRASGDSQYGLQTASVAPTVQRQARLSQRFASAFMNVAYPSAPLPSGDARQKSATAGTDGAYR